MGKSTIILFLLLACVFASRSDAAEPATAAQTARQLANCGEWQQAIENYNKALITTPKDSVCLARRGFAYARLGNYKQAFVDFAGAIECDTNCADAYSRRGRVYGWLGLEQLAKQDAEKALKLIVTVPDEADLLLEHAGLLNTVDKKQEADQESKQVLATCSQGKDVSTLINASGAHYNLHQYKDSVNCLSQALKLAPECLDLHFLRSCSYWQLNQWALANTELDHYIISNDHNPIAFWCKGNCCYYQGDYARAVADYDQAIKLAPNFVYAFYWRGVAYHYLNDYEKAMSDFSSAISLEPTNAYAYGERGHIYCHQKAWAKALKDAQQALLLNPKYSKAYTTQGWAHSELGQFPQAIDDYNKAVDLAPKDSTIYYGRGMCYRAHKQYKEAIDAYTEALTYKASDAYATAKLAEAKKNMPVDIVAPKKEPNPLSLKYPQGKTEQTVSDKIGTRTTIILVKGEEAWTYTKTIFSFGTRVFQKDGVTITENQYENETR